MQDIINNFMGKMVNKTSRFVGNTLMGIIAAAGIYISTGLFKERIERASPIQRVEFKHKRDIVVDLAERNKRAIYEKIDSYLVDFYAGNKARGIESYIDGMIKSGVEEVRQSMDILGEEIAKEEGIDIKSENGKKRIREAGRKAGIEGFVSYDRIYLARAMQRAGAKVSNEDLQETGEACVLHQKLNARKTYVDHAHPAVLDAYCNQRKGYSAARIDFFKTIIERNVDFLNKNPLESLGDFEEMLSRTFKGEDGERELEEQLKAQKEARAFLYRAFGVSIKENFRADNLLWQGIVRTFGPDKAKSLGEVSTKLHERETRRAYGVGERLKK